LLHRDEQDLERRRAARVRGRSNLLADEVDRRTAPRNSLFKTDLV
jgi:hypothetical protein